MALLDHFFPDGGTKWPCLTIYFRAEERNGPAMTLYFQEARTKWPHLPMSYISSLDSTPQGFIFITVAAHHGTPL